MFLTDRCVSKMNWPKPWQKSSLMMSFPTFIRFDMSEVRNSQLVVSMSPPGCVGYEEGGELTEKVRNKPCTRSAVSWWSREGPTSLMCYCSLDDGAHSKCRKADSQIPLLSWRQTLVRQLFVLSHKWFFEPKILVLIRKYGKRMFGSWNLPPRVYQPYWWKWSSIAYQVKIMHYMVKPLTAFPAEKELTWNSNICPKLLGQKDMTQRWEAAHCAEPANRSRRHSRTPSQVKWKKVRPP